MVKVSLSKIENKTKPDLETIKKISASIARNPVDISIQELAEEIACKGKTVVLSTNRLQMLNKDIQILGQELIMLDFDNKDKSNKYTIKDLKKDEFIQKNALFYYKTFSDSSSKVDKFRVVFQLPKVVEENKEIEEIYQNLFGLYPMSDTKVGQTSRLFFGSNQGYTVINWDNRLNLEDSSLMYINTLEPNVLIDDSTPIYKLLKYKKYELVKRKLGNKYSEEFTDDVVAMGYFKRQNMKELLELPDGNPFYDILHEEENPSASVFYSSDVDVYLYKCFSSTKEFTGDIIILLKRYLGLDYYAQATDILINCTNSVINARSELGVLKRDVLNFRKNLLNGELAKTHPKLYSYYKGYVPEIAAFMDMLFDYTYTDIETGEIKYLTYISIDRLTKYIETATKSKISRTKVWNMMNLVVVTELITKLGIDAIPKSLYETLIKIQENTKQVRTSNVYSPLIKLEYSEEIAEMMRTNNVTIGSLSYEVIYRLFGEEKANKDFPQAYEPLKQKKLIKMSKDNENLTEKQVDFEEITTKILFKEISEKGYCYNDFLIEKIMKKTNLSNSSCKIKLSKIRPDLLNKYNLKFERITIDLQKKLEIKLLVMNKYMFYIEP